MTLTTITNFTAQDIMNRKEVKHNRYYEFATTKTDLTDYIKTYVRKVIAETETAMLVDVGEYVIIEKFSVGTVFLRARTFRENQVIENIWNTRA